MSAIAQTPPPSLETPPALASDLCWLLSRASHALMTESTAALDGSGISPRDHSVLATAMTGAHTQIELARLVGLDKTTMVVTVDALEAAGLAERRPSSSDRRVRVVAVTKAGARKVREAEAILERVRNDVLSTLRPAEREVFLSALSQLACSRLADPVPCAHTVRRRV
jgi:DNA-binding MarR family transcriptional regulator